jgi:type II secretory pathway pseudopilin PulG
MNMQNANQNDSKAFTVLELIIACLIIVVLVALAIPAYLNQVEESKGAKALENLHVMRNAQLLYLGEYGNYTSSAVALQRYSPFPINDGDWNYAVNGAADTFTVTATRQTGAYINDTISINELSEVDYNGTLHTAGGSWPP